MLLGFADAQPLMGQLAAELSWPTSEILVHRFPDGESRITLPRTLPERIILCRSLHDPNAKLVELMLAARGARELGVRHITLLAPYLCYMRQDAAFQPGEVVSQRAIGGFLAGLFDALVTVDPHLHRTASLHDAVPTAKAIALSAAPLMGEFLAGRGRPALLLGPDAESEQWVRVVAEAAALDFAVASKVRKGDKQVAIELPRRDYRNREVVLVDDVASTGRTLIEAARAVLAAGAARVDALVTHALFADDAFDNLLAADIRQVWSSDSIAHPSNAFSLAKELAAAIRQA